MATRRATARSQGPYSGFSTILTPRIVIFLLASFSEPLLCAKPSRLGPKPIFGGTSLLDLDFGHLHSYLSLGVCGNDPLLLP